MSTIVQYNGIELHNVLTKEFRQEVVYDASNTDKLYNKFTITVEGISHRETSYTDQSEIALQSQRVKTASIGDLPGDFQGMHKLILNQLGVPRGYFKMFLESQNGVAEIILLEATGGVGQIPLVDVDNGPKPRDILITEIVSNKVYKVSFTIDICLTFCDIGRYSQFVLNNRWSVGESMDDNFFTTRTIRGRLRMAYSADNGGATMPGHAVKYLVIPPLEWGFKRQSIDYVASENQLDCEYTIVDRQVHKAAPWPATKMEITHSTGTSDGFTGRAECSVILEGPPHVQSILLMIRAIQIIELRLGLKDINQGDDYLVEDASFINHIGESVVVEARMRIGSLTKFKKTLAANSPAGLLQKLFIACGDGEFTDEAGNMLLEAIPNYGNYIYDEGKSPIPDVYGYDPKAEIRSPVNLFIRHCYLQSPCTPAKGMDQSNAVTQVSHHTPESGPRVQGYQYPAPTLPEYQDSKYSTGTQQAIYTYCAYETTYSYHPLRVHLPRAVGIDASETEDTSVVAQLGGKQATREIVLHYERLGVTPNIPEPVDTYREGNVTAILLKHWQTWYPPQLTNDGVKQMYRVDAHYLYGLSRPPLKSEPIPIGVLPYTNLKAKDMTITQQLSYGHDEQSVSTNPNSSQGG